MADYGDLLAKAGALGEALAAHPTVRDYHAAQKAARDDRTAQELVTTYQTQLGRIRTLEASGKPVEVADKQKLKTIEQQMSGSDVLKRLMRAQADYIDLMNRVNQAMDAPLAALATPES